jgi:ribose transport system substrate-binding protein
MKRLRTKAIVAVGLAGVSLLAACSSKSTPATGTSRTATSGAQQAGSSGDITKLCGTKPMKVGFLKSVGGNSWVLQAAAEFKDEAKKCSNISTALFSQAINDQQKAISDINSFVAQGVNVIVISADYGAPELPAIRKATQAGVKVVAILGDAGGKAGTDFVDSVNFDTDYIGKSWAAFLNTHVKTGTVAFLGGTPGNATSTSFFASFQKAMRAYPKIKIVENRVQDTNWDPAVRKKVMAGLLAKYGRTDAIASDFNGPDTGALQAYAAANMKPPTVVSITSNNAIGCSWAKTSYPFEVMNQTSSMTRLALRIGVAAYEGTTDSESALLRPKPADYLPGGKAPACNPALPPDADLSANLSPAQLSALFGK